MSPPIIAVVGATGVVGRQVVAALHRQDVEPEDVRLFASTDSEGEELDYGDETLPVEKIEADAFRGVQAVILACPPNESRRIAAQARQQGCWIVDTSSADRVDLSVPLLSGRPNDAALLQQFSGRMVSLAHPAVSALAAIVDPLREAAGVAFVDATVLVGAASFGKAGVDQLSRQTAELMNAKDPDIAVFPHRLAFNVVPEVGEFEGAHSHLEREMLIQLARLWSGDELPAVTTTALLAPFYHGLSLVVSLHTKRAMTNESVRSLLSKSPGLKLLDDPSAHVYPMPQLTVDDPAVHVGRIRVHGERVQLVAACDSATRIAETAVTSTIALARRA